LAKVKDVSKLPHHQSKFIIIIFMVELRQSPLGLAPTSVESISIDYQLSSPSVEPIFVPQEGTQPRFGISQRVLSNSNRMYAPSDLSVPPPGSYDIDKSTRISFLQNLHGVTRWKLKFLKSKLREVDSVQTAKERNDLLQEVKFLSKRLEALRQEIDLGELVSSANSSKFPSPTKPAFNATSKKPHQEPPKYQTAPTFYRSSQDWDFGSDSRSSSHALPPLR
jgi:hypothetical protein